MTYLGSHSEDSTERERIGKHEGEASRYWKWHEVFQYNYTKTECKECWAVFETIIIENISVCLQRWSGMKYTEVYLYEVMVPQSVDLCALKI